MVVNYLSARAQPEGEGYKYHGDRGITPMVGQLRLLRI